jgi:hypothetical protein
VFDDFFEESTVDVAALETLMLGPVTKDVPTRLKPNLKLSNIIGLISGTVRERDLHVVVVEDKSLDEEVRVRFVNGHKNHSAVTILTESLDVFDALMVDKHAIQNCSKKFV